MQGLDFANTKVLLIGASEFPNDPGILNIPNVAVNIKKLEALLQDAEVMGIPEANITTSLNEGKDKVETKLNRIAKATNTKEHTLIVYYTGHGIYSKHDYKLYLTTSQATEEDLEALGVRGDIFKEYIRRSNAGRKIVILDCCYSGKLLDSMGGTESNVETLLNSFEGTYVMASSASDEPSLYPKDEKERPTYFTEKLLETINGGLENKSELCSLDDIFSNIEQALVQDGRPRPQQSVFKSVGEIGLCKNKKFVPALPDYEVAWQKALLKNNKWGYFDYKSNFKSSPYAEDATNRLAQIEDEEGWQLAKKANTLKGFSDYLDRQENGRYKQEAERLIEELRKKDNFKDSVIENGKEKAKAVNENFLDETINKTAAEPSDIFVNSGKIFSEIEFASKNVSSNLEANINRKKVRSKINGASSYSVEMVFIKIISIIALILWCTIIIYHKKINTESVIDSRIDHFFTAKSLLDAKEYKKGLDLLFELAYNGNVKAQNQLGNMFSDDNNIDGTNQDYWNAFVWYSESAKLGNAEGQYNLGRMYEIKNWAIDSSFSWYKRRDSALKWYRKSAEQGYVEGQYALGKFYGNRRSSYYNYSLDSAKKWYKKAAYQGHEKASEELSKLNIAEENTENFRNSKRPQKIDTATEKN